MKLNRSNSKVKRESLVFLEGLPEKFNGMQGGQQKPPLEGYLEKQGDDVFKSWKKRWFALDGDKLIYYRNQSDAPTRAIDFISLAPGTQLKRVEKIRGPKYDNCGLALLTPNRTYLLLAETKATRDKWLLELLSAHPHLSKAATTGITKDDDPTLNKPLHRYTKSFDASDITSSSVEQPSTTTTSTTATSSNQTTTPTPNIILPTSSNLPPPSIVSPTLTVPAGFSSNSNGSDSDKVEKRKSLLPFTTFSRGKEGKEDKDDVLARPWGNSSAVQSKQKEIADREVHTLREELVRRDKELDEKDKRLRYAESALADISEKYFVSVAVFAKMNAAAGGCYCNIDVHDLYAQAQRERVPLDDWPSWITKQIQSNSRRIRT